MSLSANQFAVLKKIEKMAVIPANKAQTIKGLIVEGWISGGFAVGFVLTDNGHIVLNDYRDAVNAMHRRVAQRERERVALERARGAKAASMTGAEIAAAYARWHAKNPGAQTGGLAIDVNGEAYEWMSWERMMSE